MSANQRLGENAFKNAPITTSKLRVVSEGKAVWELKNWSDADSYELLKKHANCVVRLSDGRAFRFFLKQQKTNSNYEGELPENDTDTTHAFECVSLLVKELLPTKPQLETNCCDHELNLIVAVQHLSDDMKPTDGPDNYEPLPNGHYWTRINVSFEAGRKPSDELTVVHGFMRLSSIPVPNPAFYYNDPAAIAEASEFYNHYSPTIFKRPENLRYGIVVKLISCDAPSSPSTH